jgi:Protein of Unknown function (DUF2784)
LTPLAAHVVATLAVAAHVTFIAFVVIGGLLVLRWRKLWYLHVAAVIWAVYVEWSGAICPLTPLENTLRTAAGLEAYAGDFVAEYVFPVLYPDGLTRGAQFAIGAAVLAVNGCVYAVLLRQRKSNTFAR